MKAEGGRRKAEFNYELRITDPLDFQFLTSYFFFLTFYLKKIIRGQKKYSSLVISFPHSVILFLMEK